MPNGGENISRDVRFDNIKGILVLLVVFGHLLESVYGGAAKGIYLLIYSFHMPAFVFVSGYFASFDLNRIFKRQIMPYLVWYAIYFVIFTLIFTEENRFDPSRPFWLTWYLMSLVWWSMSLPLLRAAGRKRIWPVIAALCAVSVLWGYSGISGYWFSIGRTLTFFPFFAMGFFAGKKGIEFVKKPPVKAAAAVLVLICAAVCICCSPLMNTQCFYGAKNYSNEGQNIALRAFQLAAGGGWILCFLCFAPKTPLPLLTNAGKYSLSVYLGHGIIVRILKKMLPGGIAGNTWVIIGAAALALLLTAAFGNRRVHGVISKTFLPVTGGWKRLLRNTAKTDSAESS